MALESDAGEARAMKRLILTTTDSGAGGLLRAKLADRVIPFGLRFVCGQLPSQVEIEARISGGSAVHEVSGSRWQDFADEHVDEIELWVDPYPNDQLNLIWLLDYLRRQARTPSNLTVIQADAPIGNHTPEELAKWRLPAVKILSDHLEAASKAWRAYRQPTPQDWFNLLGEDISLLPQLQQSVLELLEELPTVGTGLGTTQMRMLELISAGNAGPFDVFPGDNKPNKRRVFGYWEVGELLDGLAHCPVPAVSGLEEGPFTLEMHEDRDRHTRYKQSRLKLTPLGEAILARTDDFSRHNPIHRWWGGTELTNDRLWRWDPQNRALVAPQ
jgi:hypothetical protein